MTRDQHLAPPVLPANTSSKSKAKAKLRPVESLLDPTLALYFSVVVEQNSITGAAEVLGVSASTVSRKIDELEASLGVRLFDRDTRNLRLAEPGEMYLHFVLKGLHILEAGNQTMERYSSGLRGKLRVLSPPAVGRRFVADAVVAFSALHPDLQVSLRLDPRPFSLGDTDFDAAISVGMPVEERAVVSRLGSMRRGFVATPGFLAEYGSPKTLCELAQLPLAELAYENQLHERMVLVSREGESALVTPRLSTNDSEVVLRAALRGALLVRMVHWYCAEHLADGRLVKVMPELDDTLELYTVVPSRKGKPLKVQVFMDFLKTHMTRELLAIDAQLTAADAASE